MLFLYFNSIIPYCKTESVAYWKTWKLNGSIDASQVEVGRVMETLTGSAPDPSTVSRVFHSLEEENEQRISVVFHLTFPGFSCTLQTS